MSIDECADAILDNPMRKFRLPEWPDWQCLCRHGILREGTPIPAALAWLARDDWEEVQP